MWSKLENTDSWDVSTIEDVDEIAHKYGRNYKKILVEMSATTHKTYCPIVVHHKNKYHLVAGNTRLMICRAMQVDPMVVIVDM